MSNTICLHCGGNVTPNLSDNSFATDCICPGSPLFQIIADSDLGRGYCIGLNTPNRKQKDKLVVWVDGKYLSIPAVHFRQIIVHAFAATEPDTMPALITGINNDNHDNTAPLTRTETTLQAPKITPEQIAVRFTELTGASKEHICIMTFNANGAYIETTNLTMLQSTTDAITTMQEVLRAILANRQCAQFVLVHNHPSGDPRASQSDVDMTETIVHYTNLIGLHMVDHIIVAKNGYWSYAAAQQENARYIM